MTYVTSSGTGTAPQQPAIAVPPGGSVQLLDSQSSVAIADQGTYSVDPAATAVGRQHNRRVETRFNY